MSSIVLLLIVSGACTAVRRVEMEDPCRWPSGPVRCVRGPKPPLESSDVTRAKVGVVADFAPDCTLGFSQSLQQARLECIQIVQMRCLQPLFAQNAAVLLAVSSAIP